MPNEITAAGQRGALDEPASAIALREPARIERMNPMQGIMLDSIDDIMQFATVVAPSTMVPQAYRGKPGDIVMAVMHGRELGLPPVMALNSIALINGRPSVWGDAVPGLCHASGKVEDIEEFFEGDEGTDGYTAVCIAKRRGMPSPKIGRFSQADAKVAGLFGKATHGSYPKRMMMWRARHFALHDAFPDVLKGIGTRELDAEDADVQAGPSWSKPAPERADFKDRGLSNQDGWDATWFQGASGKLLGEPNAWQWVKLLLAALKAAPTKRDVDEISDLPIVEKTIAGIPDNEDGNAARARIIAAFAAARDRTSGSNEDQAKRAADEKAAVEQAAAAKAKGAAQPAGTPISSEEPGKAAASGIFGDEPISGGEPFEAILVDEYGDIVREFNHPAAFAAAFLERWVSVDEARQEALVEANQDSLDEASRIDKHAFETLAPVYDQPSERPGEDAEDSLPPVYEAVPVLDDRGKPAWPLYVKTVKDKLKDTGAADLSGWCEAQILTLGTCPMAQRMLIVRAMSDACGKAGVTPPLGLASLVRAKAAGDKPVMGKPAEKPVEKPVEAESVTDPDEHWVNSIIPDLAAITERDAFFKLAESTAIKTKMAGLRRHKPALFERADAAFAAALARTKKGDA